MTPDYYLWSFEGTPILTTRNKTGKLRDSSLPDESYNTCLPFFAETINTRYREWVKKTGKQQTVRISTSSPIKTPCGQSTATEEQKRIFKKSIDENLIDLVWV
jgi:hypothetical protein